MIQFNLKPKKESLWRKGDTLVVFLQARYYDSF